MRNFLILFLSISLLISCSEEDLAPSNNQNSVSAYLNNYLIPSVLFSVNSFDIQSGTKTTHFIDDEGQIRKFVNEDSKAFDYPVLLVSKLEDWKLESDVTDFEKVEIKKLAENFLGLASIDNLEFIEDEIGEESSKIETVYGYTYYEVVDEDCGCAEYMAYQPMLLYQKIDDQEVATSISGQQILNFVLESIPVLEEK